MWVGAVPGGSVLWSLASGVMIAHFRWGLHPPTCLLLLEAVTFVEFVFRGRLSLEFIKFEVYIYFLILSAVILF